MEGSFIWCLASLEVSLCVLHRDEPIKVRAVDTMFDKFRNCDIYVRDIVYFIPLREVLRLLYEIYYSNNASAVAGL